MTNLTAVVKTTRASAAAVQTMQRIAFEMQHTSDPATLADLLKRHTLARKRYKRAQDVLQANPLPGDKP